MIPEEFDAEDFAWGWITDQATQVEFMDIAEALQDEYQGLENDQYTLMASAVADWIGNAKVDVTFDYDEL